VHVHVHVLLHVLPPAHMTSAPVLDILLRAAHCRPSSPR
jgi:hypothetical protein